MKSRSLLLALLVTLFARLAIAEVLVSGAAMLQWAAINDWRLLSLRATASTELFLASEFLNTSTQLRPERFYRKKNGHLYQFRYAIKDGKMVYEEKESSKGALVQSEIEGELQQELSEGEVVLVQESGRLPLPESQDIDDLTPAKSLIIELAKAKYISVIKVVEGSGPPPRIMASQPSGEPGKASGNKALAKASEEKKTRVTRSQKGRVTKPQASSKPTRKTLSSRKGKTGRTAARYKQYSSESDMSEPESDTGPSQDNSHTDSSPDTMTFPVPAYDEPEYIEMHARQLGLQEALVSDTKPELDGLTDWDWEGLSAFDDMVKGLTLAGRMNLRQLQAWLKKKRQLRTAKRGLHTSQADAYIDLCLQHMALIHWHQILYTHWRVFYGASRNLYVHIQQYFQDHPEASWETFTLEHSLWETYLIDAIENTKDEDLGEIRQLLQDATGLEEEGFPEYLFAGR